MAESSATVLGEGLVYQDALPLRWTRLDAPPQPVQWQRVQQDNEEVLRLIAMLDEHPSEGGDESGVPNQDLVRLNLKLDLMLSLLGQLLAQQLKLPEAKPCSLSAHGLEWHEQRAPTIGQYLAVELFLSAKCPRPITLFGRLALLEDDGEGPRAGLAFDALSEPVQEWLEKIIFRHHRRGIAFARRATPSPEQ